MAAIPTTFLVKVGNPLTSQARHDSVDDAGGIQPRSFSHPAVQVKKHLSSSNIIELFDLSRNRIVKPE